VLDSGQRTLVYVEREKGLYESRDVTLGPKAGEYYPVLQGLKEGEFVAVRGNFLLDSQAQISGSPSLFYPHGAGGVHTQGGATSSDREVGPSRIDQSGHNH
jgi:membrane fusion protein, copper/silver efflux system